MKSCCWNLKEQVLYFTSAVENAQIPENNWSCIIVLKAQCGVLQLNTIGSGLH